MRRPGNDQSKTNCFCGAGQAQVGKLSIVPQGAGGFQVKTGRARGALAAFKRTRPKEEFPSRWDARNFEG